MLFLAFNTNLKQKQTKLIKTPLQTESSLRTGVNPLSKEEIGIIKLKPKYRIFLLIGF